MVKLSFYSGTGIKDLKYPSQYDSLVYNPIGNVIKILQFVKLYNNFIYINSLSEVFEYDNKEFKNVSFEFLHREYYYHLFQNRNNIIKVIRYDQLDKQNPEQNPEKNPVFDISFEYDTNNNPVKVLGTYQDKPVNLTITYNCK